ncbi:hypothetical protein C8Q72DRAFT_948840 [Fomitopsis betulina]|nr:hypothetical protein C8Q72DRAFT_948840 [Fomitopsis betulina]
MPGSEAETVAPLLTHQPPAQSSAPIWFTEGETLDYLLGGPLSVKLRALPLKDRLAAIPVNLRPAILEVNIAASFPPTVLVHGLADIVVLPSESQATYDKHKKLDVKTELIPCHAASTGCSWSVTGPRWHRELKRLWRGRCSPWKAN